MRSEDKWIWSLLITSVLIICCTDFWFDSIPAYSNFLYKLGRTANNLSLAYISSVMFYWIIVSIPDKRKKKSMYKYFYGKTNEILSDFEILMSEFIGVSNYTPSNKILAKTDLDAILLKIHPYGQASRMIGPNPVKWLEWMDNRRLRSINAITEILSTVVFLESEAEFVKLLTDLKGCIYFISLPSIMSLPLSNTDLLSFSESIDDYYLKLKKLKEYSDKNFSKYSKDSVAKFKYL